MRRYNLLDEKWIPVMRADDVMENVSLKQLFDNAHHYKCLAGDMETQNFALIRVLLAVLITVFTRVDQEGSPYEMQDLDDRMVPVSPVDEEDADNYLDALDTTWEKIWKMKKFPAIINDYLEKWRDHFYLLDDQFPFYQVTDKVMNTLGVKAKKLITSGNLKGQQFNRLISESGNKVDIFSPVTADQKNRMDEAELARWLTTMQGYFGTSDKVKPENFQEDNWSKGWLYDIGGIYPQGKNLFETLMMNMILHHPEDKQERGYSISIQTPCWELDPEENVKRLLNKKPIDNLAALYTLWCRAVYIHSDWKAGEDVLIGIVKVPDINKENFFLEPMTLWKKAKDESDYYPCTLKPEQALWRSFGMITLNDDSNSLKRPIAIDYLQNIKKYLDDENITIQAVGMKPDGNATSWMPVDEILDELHIDEMVLMDNEEKGSWIIRINDSVEDTKKRIDQYYRNYLKKIAAIRGLGANFIDVRIAAVYELVDQPFREWLMSIHFDDSKEEKTEEWKSIVNGIILERALAVQGKLTMRDCEVRELKYDNRNLGNINLPIAYNQLRAVLRR